MLVNKACSTLVAEEAGLMPMFLFVGEILAVNSNNLAALITIVGKYIFIAFYTVWMVISQHISEKFKHEQLALKTMDTLYFLPMHSGHVLGVNLWLI